MSLSKLSGKKHREVEQQDTRGSKNSSLHASVPKPKLELLDSKPVVVVGDPPTMPTAHYLLNCKPLQNTEVHECLPPLNFCPAPLMHKTYALKTEAPEMSAHPAPWPRPIYYQRAPVALNFCPSP
jgi:hypothetical protein